MISKGKIAGIIIGAGVSVWLLWHLIKSAAAAEELLTLNISEAECAPGAPITFEGRYTIKGEGEDGVNIYPVNETTSEALGPSLTVNGGFYSLSSTAPLTARTYQYRAYTEDQLPL